jgi:hypothetical protein
MPSFAKSLTKTALISNTDTRIQCCTFPSDLGHWPIKISNVRLVIQSSGQLSDRSMAWAVPCPIVFSLIRTIHSQFVRRGGSLLSARVFVLCVQPRKNLDRCSRLHRNLAPYMIAVRLGTASANLCACVIQVYCLVSMASSQVLMTFTTAKNPQVAGGIPG